MTIRGMAPSMAVEGATTGAVFDAYAEGALCPSPSPGQVVMEDLSAHKGGRTRELIGEGVASSHTCRPTHLLSTA